MPRVPRASSMKATAKEAVQYLFPGDVRPKKQYYFKSQTMEDLHTAMGVNVPSVSTEETATASSSKGKKGAKPSMKRTGTMAKTVAEAKRLLDGEETITAGKRTRAAKKATPAKPAMKRAGTMQNTAKEGKSFLKRTKGRKGKGKK
ncbi:uncharacterized protein LOC143301903 [Babylonia areolata]|uniref:uncharacterized protein LOC143301903 n=1 Tax=Babylonia areolata TaxID=304850 RepID=UPI003FCF3F5D